MTPKSSANRAAQVRREIDILIEARQGIGTSSLYHAIAVAAVEADEGEFENTNGEAGYAWRPDKYPTPLHRIHTAGASLGRVLTGSRCDMRTYLALIEGIYFVTVNQDYDVTSRVEKLWATVPEVEVEVEAGHKPSVWRRIFSWLRDLWKPSVHYNHAA